jgi:hypothetical protein
VLRKDRRHLRSRLGSTLPATGGGSERLTARQVGHPALHTKLVERGVGRRATLPEPEGEEEVRARAGWWEASCAASAVGGAETPFRIEELPEQSGGFVDGREPRRLVRVLSNHGRNLEREESHGITRAQERGTTSRGGPSGRKTRKPFFGAVETEAVIWSETFTRYPSGQMEGTLPLLPRGRWSDLCGS